MSKILESVRQLQDVVHKLCSPEGCEWDRAQTPESLCEYVLEESCELIDAIRNGSIDDVKEELGDVFFLLFFQQYLHALTDSSFTLENVLDQVSAKMIRRHPHVFEGVVFENLDEQLKAWEAIKRAEKEQNEAAPAKTFDSLPAGLPSLTKAYRLHSKAARNGFTWDSDDDALQQVEAEWLEMLDAFAFGTGAEQEEELGDLIFTLVELGRRKGIKANAALEASNTKFLRRFNFMEEHCQADGKSFDGLSMEEKNILWDSAKQAVSPQGKE